MWCPLYVVDFLRQEVPKRAPGSMTLVCIGSPDTWVTVEPEERVPAGVDIVGLVAYDFKERQTVFTRES